MKKKLLAAVVAAAMCLTCIPAGAMAAGTAKKAINVKYTCSLNDSFIMADETLAVSKDLGEKYYPESAKEEPKDEVSILDVMVAAQLKKYGEAFAKDTEKYMSVDNGFVTKLFEKSTGIQYTVNNEMLLGGPTKDTVKNGDVVKNMISSPTDTNWESQVTFFEKEDAVAKAGKVFKTSLSAIGYKDSKPVTVAPPEFTVKKLNKKTLKLSSQNAKVKKDGKIELIFNNVGVQYISAAEKKANTMFAPIMKVTVGLDKIAFKSAKAGKKKATLKWKKAAGAKKYQVYRANKKNGKFKKVVTVKKTSFVNKKLKKGKTYFYKVRAIAKADGKTYKGAFSKVKKVKVK